MDGEVIYDAKQKALEAVQILDQLRKSKQHYDFIIKVEDEEIPVHRHILIANSKFFEAMLSHDTAENQQGFVVLKEVDIECVKFAVDFVYCGRLMITEAKLDDFCRVADIWQVHGLLDSLSAFLHQKLTTRTFFAIKSIAKKHSYSELEEKCDMFALENFESISKENEFNALDLQYLSFLVLSENNQGSESLKLKAVLEWVRYDIENRSSCLHSILGKLQLGQIPLGCRRYLIEEEPLTCESFEITRLITKSILDDLNVQKKDLSTSVCTEEPNRIIAFDETSKHIQCFDPSTKTWTKMNPLRSDMKRSNFSPVVLGDSLYILMASKEVYRLQNPGSNASWEKMADMIEEHGMWPQGVTDGKHIYAVGKWSSELVGSGGIERYNPVKDEWDIISEEIPNARSSVIHLKGFIYCIGGKQATNLYLKTVQTYEIVSGKWNTVASLTTARCFAAVTIHQGKIFVMGGLSTSGERESSLECYDTVTNSWSLLSPMLIPRTGFNAFTFGDVIYAVGEYNERPSSIEEYNIFKDTWKKLDLKQNINILWSVGFTIR